MATADGSVIILLDGAKWSRVSAAVMKGDGSLVDLATILAAIDPANSGFQAAFTKLYAAWAANLPVYSGTGPAPVPAGQPFLNNGTPQIAQ